MQRISFISIAIISLLAGSSLSGYAQKAFAQSQVLVNGGVVFFNGAAPVTASVEYAITEQVGAGIRGYSARSGNGYNILNGAVYANYHLLRLARVDPFAGLMLDKMYYTNNSRGVDPASQPINLNVQAGARYLFTSRLGGYVQAAVPFRAAVGFSAELGLSVKF